VKVLFVCSGNSKFGISPFIKSQGLSLKTNGVELDYFTIKGKGLKGYLSNIKLLRKCITKGDYDITHSHYSLTAFICSLALIGIKKPQVTSLMGSDVNTKGIDKLIIKFFNIIFWKKVIVKSEDMKDKIGIKKSYVIPNGVDFAFFKPMEQITSKRQVNFDASQKQVVWISNPERYAKNFDLARKAFTLAELKNVELKVISGVKPETIPYYLNAADVLLLSSRWEGSPNIIKEAMACNCPIVTTRVGDVEYIIGNTEGCFIVEQNEKEVAEAIKKCIEFGKRTDGREKIKHLEINTIAKKIIDVYRAVLT
jgi:glycosyltransferase involved in cell wall biosynthesis